MQTCSDDLIIDQTHPSPNYNQRVFFLVLHYTAEDLDKSLKTLTDGTSKNPVSAHYLIPETNINKERRIFQLVKESERAWHAGISTWQNRTNLNDTSIGVEIVNLGYKDEEGIRKWYPFTNYQIESVIELAKIIVERYQIFPTRFIGHSDIAPGRKVDPGPLFPWEKLYANGIGAWFDQKAVKKEMENHTNILDIKQLQTNLLKYGYGIQITGELDKQTTTILQAFQMHFRSSNYSGEPDAETIAILNNLIEKYYPNS
ncbi:MAG: N-acetylmuramoyl-L-alanine amidase [Rickettsiella sp.]|nr:N-acetylmuramoyl-L-alanine amidase [Rickettsiella sp.]